jgi:hypothetical protein
MPARIVGLVRRIIVSTAIVVWPAIVIAGSIIVPGAIVVAIVFVVLSPLLGRYRAGDHPKRHPYESCPCRISSMIVPVTASRTEIRGAA